MIGIRTFDVSHDGEEVQPRKAYTRNGPIYPDGDYCKAEDAEQWIQLCLCYRNDHRQNGCQLGTEDICGFCLAVDYLIGKDQPDFTRSVAERMLNGLRSEYNGLISPEDACKR